MIAAERTAEQPSAEAGPRLSAAERRRSMVEDDDDEDDEDEEEEDELRRAARAGILLLETNTELQHENAALRLQVQALESERPRLAEELARRASELELLREERRQGLLETTRLQGELRATSQLVTASLDREQRLRQQSEAADAALAAAEDKLRVLRQELAERSVAGGAERPSSAEHAKHPVKEEVVVANPAATYDANQRSAFTLAEHEELLAKWQRAARENESLLVEMKSLKKDLEASKRRAAKLGELAPRLERLEKKAAKLQLTNDALAAELTEERALNESQRTMIGVYKKIADARPFSTECTCALHPEDALGVSVQEQLLENNVRLEKELREVRARLALTASMVKEEQQDDAEDAAEEEEDAPTADDSTDNNSSHTNNGDHDVDEMLRVSETETTLVGFETVASNTDVDFLIKRIQDLEEKQAALKDSLRHAKHQWQAAIASQKALEECNRAAQAEITRLTQQVEHKVAALQRHGGGDGALVQESGSAGEHGENADNDDDDHTNKAPDGTFEDADDEERWTEEMAPYPAPPGDLNSPLIKCLLDHWTTDKSKIMHLTDWLHHAIRGTGKPRPLRLEHLTSEVAAGFTQLLVPILRERHGVSVKIYRRESIQILTDMVFQAHQPTQPPETPGFFSTLAAAISGVIAPSSSSPAASSLLFAEEIRARVERSNSSGSGASSESGSARVRRRRQENPFAMSEAHFLYG